MSSSDPRFDEILAAWMKANSAQREQILAAHPEYATQLQRFADNERWLHDAVAADATTTHPLDTGNTSEPPRVRYVGDYEILQELARGAMGVVYRARQISLGREVALKMVLAGERASDDQLRRFRAEAEAAANLDHPHIVPVFEVGVHEGQPYFTMKLIEGGSLAQSMSRLKGKSREIALLLAKAARAVHHAHQRGVLHRDIKPGNILLDEKGEPHVADFGLARRGEGGASLSGAVIGTPAYMAPEQARAEKGLTVAADVWSLGAVLYELLSGRPPFSGENALDVLVAVVNQEPQPLPGDLGVVALKCLHKEPARRYPSASELADDLDRWLRGEPISARPAGTVERVINWARRKPAQATAWVLATLALLLMAFSLVVARFWREAESARDLAEERLGKAEQAELVAQQAEQRALRSREKLARIEYARTVTLANREYQNNDLVRAREYLAQCRTDLRGWEWHYVHKLCHADRYTISGDNEARAGTISPDGKWLLTCSEDAVHFHELETGEVVKTIKEPGPVRSASFASDGRRVLTLAGGVARIRDRDSGKVLHELKSTTPIVSATFNPTGTRVLTGLSSPALFADGLPKAKPALPPTFAFAKVWDASTGAELATLTEKTARVDLDIPWLKGKVDILSPINEIGYTGSGTRIVTKEESSATIRDVEGRPLRQIESCEQAIPHPVGDSALTVEAPQRSLGTQYLRERGTAEAALWEANLDKRSIKTLACSPDGKHILLGQDTGLIVVRKQRADKPLYQLKGHTSPVTAVEMSRDGQWVVSRAGKEVKVWAVTEARERQEEEADLFERIVYVTLKQPPWGGKSGSPTIGIHLLTPFFREDYADNELLPGLARAATTVSNLLSMRIGLADVLTRFRSRRFGHEAGFSPDSKTLVVGSNRVDVAFGVGKGLQEKNGWEAFAFTSDGHLVYQVRGDPPLVAITSLKTGQRSRAIRLPRGKATALAVAPEGKTLFAGTDLGDLVTIDLVTGMVLRQYQVAPREVTAVAFSADGTRMATSCGREAKIWAFESGEELMTLKGHSGSIKDIAFTSVGRILTLASDHTLHIWDDETGHEVFSADCSGRGSIHLSADGNTLVASGGTVKSAFLTDGTWNIDITFSSWLWGASKPSKVPFDFTFTGIVIRLKETVFDARPVNRAIRVRQR